MGKQVFEFTVTIGPVGCTIVEDVEVEESELEDMTLEEQEAYVKEEYELSEWAYNYVDYFCRKKPKE